MNIKAIGDRVILSPLKTESKKGSLYIPESARKPTQEGVIRSVGKDVSLPVKPGDHVIYDEYAGRKVYLDWEEDITYLVMKEESLIAKVEK